MNDHWNVLYQVFVFMPLEDLQMIIPVQFGFNCPSSRHFPFYIGTKNLNFVEDHPMNIPV
jgi:hypothetical protein